MVYMHMNIYIYICIIHLYQCGLSAQQASRCLKFITLRSIGALDNAVVALRIPRASGTEALEIPRPSVAETRETHCSRAPVVALAIGLVVQHWSFQTTGRKSWIWDPDAVQRWIRDNADIQHRLEGASVDELKAVAVELQNAAERPGTRKVRHGPRLSLKTRLDTPKGHNAGLVADRKCLLLQARASRRADFQKWRLAHICDLLARGCVLSRSSALHNIDAVRWPNGQTATSDKESVEIVAAHYREKWCTEQHSHLGVVGDFEDEVPDHTGLDPSRHLTKSAMLFPSSRSTASLGLIGCVMLVLAFCSIISLSLSQLV